MGISSNLIGEASKSRKENYYHPVVDLLGDDMRAMLTRKFFDFVKTVPPSEDTAFYDDVLMKGYWEDFGLSRQISFEQFKYQYTHTRNTYNGIPGAVSLARFHRIADHPQLREDKEIMDVLGSLVDAYGTTKVKEKPEGVFLHTYGRENVLPRHIDPGNVAKVTIPLFPDYANYRNLDFYETKDENIQPNPSHTVNYSKFRSPVLLNPAKIHAISDSQSDSLCLQLVFYEGYDVAMKKLSKKGLLSSF